MTPKESMAKSREWQCRFRRFLAFQGPTAGQQWEWVRPAEEENGWEWIARQALERRMAHEREDKRLFWRTALSEQSSVLSTTVPIRPAHEPRVMELGKFATTWNCSRQRRLILTERRRVEENTQHLNERCRDCRATTWDVTWNSAPEGRPSDWRPRDCLQPGVCNCRMGCYHPMDKGHFPFCLYCDLAHHSESCCCPCVMCHPDTDSTRPQDLYKAGGSN